MSITKKKTIAAASEVHSRVRVSLNPEKFTQGGLIDDVDVTITDAGTLLYDYNGTVAVAVPALALELTQADGTTSIQYFGAGKSEDWEPAEDGEGFYALTGKSSINNSCNLGRLLASLHTTGFPAEALDSGNLKVLIGTKVHVIQEVIERKGLIRTGKNADRPSTVLVVSKILELPASLRAGSGAATASVSTATPTTAQAAQAESNGAAAAVPAAGDLDAQIQEILLNHLATTGEPLAKKDVARTVRESGVFQGKDNQKAIIRSINPEFLSGLEAAGISYDGAALSLA